MPTRPTARREFYEINKGVNDSTLTTSLGRDWSVLAKEGYTGTVN